jgi:hypothetical protein
VGRLRARRYQKERQRHQIPAVVHDRQPMPSARWFPPVANDGRAARMIVRGGSPKRSRSLK